MRTATPGRSLLLRASCVEHATPATQRNVARGVSGHCVVHCTQLRRNAVSTSPLLPLVAAHPVIRDMHHVAVGASSVLPATALLVAVEGARRTAVRMENAALGKGGAVCAQRRCHDAHHRQGGGCRTNSNLAPGGDLEPAQSCEPRTVYIEGGAWYMGSTHELNRTVGRRLRHSARIKRF